MRWVGCAPLSTRGHGCRGSDGGAKSKCWLSWGGGFQDADSWQARAVIGPAGIFRQSDLDDHDRGSLRSSVGDAKKGQNANTRAMYLQRSTLCRRQRSSGMVACAAETNARHDHVCTRARAVVGAQRQRRRWIGSGACPARGIEQTSYGLACNHDVVRTMSRFNVADLERGTASTVDMQKLG